MQITEAMVRDVVQEILKQMATEGKLPAASAAAPVAQAADQAGELDLKSLGEAKPGSAPNEIVIGLAPAFGDKLKKRTIAGIPHAAVLRELMAGIEEQGVKARVVRITRTSDVAFIAHDAAKMSGSGVGIGIQSRGTTVIHQRDLLPLSNLELFPQAPLIDLEMYRAIGRNAARYAKGESPSPVPQTSDQMTRPKYQAIAAIYHNRETSFVQPGGKPIELQVSYK
jgi:propanediol dehydratase medium subunit